ncbi:argininosuccinate lyase, chloroplastic isoform X1 [Oryza brachyantha]|uniref:argininosuccinate lyase, chloroplastic isoform X1 n=1 Tax=Oryza brachyantha TaxID=4533 RepID=UPI001ADB2779|nr:argininosuccinate lyase, chloroplastic isoform X1 [Oryza brachyantha]
MSTATPRGRSSQRRSRCKCAGGGGDRSAPCCFHPLRSLFRCPGRGRGRRSRSRSRHATTPSKVRDAPVAGAEQESEEPSFFVYAMPDQGGGAAADHSKKKKNKKKKKNRKARLPSIHACFRGKKNRERKASAAVIERRQALTPAPSLVTHPPHSPSTPEKTRSVAPSVTQPPSPAVTENGGTHSPALPNRIPGTPRPGKKSTGSSTPSPSRPQWQQPKQVEGLEIVEVATGERLSAHDVGLIEMVGSSNDVSAESSVKSSLDYVNEPPPQLRATKPTALEKTQKKATEPPRLWLNGKTETGTAGERFTGPPVAGEADELWAHDIACSRVHATMLAETGLITAGDKDIILEGLDQIEKLIQDGKFEWRTDREDVHMNIEAALIEKVGEPAKKLHTARSRNDQIVTDLRLWCRDAIDKILFRIKQFQVSLVLLASKYVDLIVPGYTHLQRAQPVLLPHLLLSYVEQLERDAGRLVNCRERLNFCPLGACALAGTGLPIDRFKTAKDLKFTAPMKNSIDAVSDRDFVLEFLAANSIAAVHLSRIGEEWVLWASEEFGFITPSDSVSTGSSIMPQKKNPDPMELVRGKSARVVGDLMTVLTLCKGLPQAYNRDLQEDKEPLFDSVKAVLGMLEVCTEFAQNISFNSKRIQSSLPAGYLDATTLADYLVKKGVPFRTSHEIVGRSVALCVSKNCQLAELGLDDLKSVHPVFEADVYGYLGVENAVNKFISYGSTGSEQVKKQLEDWRTQLGISS